MSKSTTDRMRMWNMGLWTLAVIGSIVGWLAGRDPGQLDILLGFLTVAIGIGEGSNVGKRATYKAEADK